VPERGCRVCNDEGTSNIFGLARVLIILYVEPRVPGIMNQESYELGEKKVRLRLGSARACPDDMERDGD